MTRSSAESRSGGTRRKTHAVLFAAAILIAAPLAWAAPSPKQPARSAKPPAAASRPKQPAPAPAAQPKPKAQTAMETGGKASPAGTGMLGEGTFLGGGDCKEPIEIESQSLTLDNKARVMTYSGDVKVTQCDLTLTSETLEITYDESQKINQMCAKGGVNITKGERAAKGERGCYDGKLNTIVLTGHPQVWQGGDAVSGETIRVFLEEERSVVEGSTSERVKTTFFPRGKPGAQGPAAGALKPLPAPGEKKKHQDGASATGTARDPIDISSLWLQMDRAASTALYRGSVEARQKDLVMTSEELYAAFDPGTRLLTEALATGNVVVTQTDRVATGKEARYKADPGEIILTGEPVLKEGGKVVRGDRIHYDMQNDRVAVVGGEEGGGRPNLVIPVQDASGGTMQMDPLLQKREPREDKKQTQW